MGFSDAVAEALGKYAVFQGRSRRSEYWWFLVFVIGSNFIASTLDRFVGLPVFGALVGLALLPPGLAVAVRRLHDTGRTGWWVLAPAVVAPTLAAIPTVAAMGGTGGSDAAAATGLVLALAVWGAYVFVMTRPGTPGPNRFGEDPKGLTAPPSGTAGQSSAS